MVNMTSISPSKAPHTVSIPANNLRHYQEYNELKAASRLLELFLNPDSDNSQVDSIGVEVAEATRRILKQLQQRLLKVECEYDKLARKRGLRRLYFWYCANKTSIPSNIQAGVASVRQLKRDPPAKHIENNGIFSLKYISMQQRSMELDDYSPNDDGCIEAIVDVKPIRSKKVAWGDKAPTEPAPIAMKRWTYQHSRPWTSDTSRTYTRTTNYTRTIGPRSKSAPVLNGLSSQNYVSAGLQGHRITAQPPCNVPTHRLSIRPNKRRASKSPELTNQVSSKRVETVVVPTDRSAEEFTNSSQRDGTTPTADLSLVDVKSASEIQELKDGLAQNGEDDHDQNIQDSITLNSSHCKTRKSLHFPPSKHLSASSISQAGLRTTATDRPSKKNLGTTPVRSVNTTFGTRGPSAAAQIIPCQIWPSTTRRQGHFVAGGNSLPTSLNQKKHPIPHVSESQSIDEADTVTDLKKKNLCSNIRENILLSTVTVIAPESSHQHDIQQRQFSPTSNNTPAIASYRHSGNRSLGYAPSSRARADLLRSKLRAHLDSTANAQVLSLFRDFKLSTLTLGDLEDICSAMDIQVAIPASTVHKNMDKKTA